MRILSKFSDYYDHVVGHSTEPVWERRTHEFPLDPVIKTQLTLEHTKLLDKMYEEMPKPSIKYKENRWKCNDTLDYMVIGFCGKVFPIFRCPNVDDSKVDHLYDRPKVKFKTFTKPSEFTNLFNKVYKDRMVCGESRWRHVPFGFTDSACERWNEKYNHQVTTEIFIALKSPIFIIKPMRFPDENPPRMGSKIEVNPNLADLNFQRVVEPYTAYQEVDMFLGNQLVGNFEPMPDFGDELKRDAHGMDDWSFKQKGPKKRKQKK